MTRLLSKVAAVATLAVTLMSSTTGAVGTAVQYTGSLCTDYVNYDVWVPPNITIAMIEGALSLKGMNATSLAKLSAFPDCKEPFLQNICASAFPRVEPAAGQAGTFNVRFACKSVCQKAVEACTPILTMAGGQDKIPQCDGPVLSSQSSAAPTGILYQPDGECNRVKSLSGGAGAGAGGDGAGAGAIGVGGVCPKPFIKDPMPNGKTANDHYCMRGCCIPCPAQYHLYREGALELGFKITDIMRAVSMVFSFILLVSYICLRDKRTHPSALILFFSLCVFLFSVVIIFPLVDRKGMQCFDDINPSTQENNLRCAIQGGMLIFASVATCAWCTAVIINLHLHTVWNSSWFAKKYWLLHILCWGFASAVTGAALGMKEVRWEFATLCLINQDVAPKMFFYPMAAMIFPAFLVHVATFVHIARISAQAGADSETMSRSTLSAGAAAMISHRRHVMMAIRIQWRAALMAVCAILSLTFYWLFYFLQLDKIKPDNLKPHITGFVMCLMKGNPHDTCADGLAPFLPPYGLMIAAEFLVSTMGTVIFIVFFKVALVREWGEFFNSIGYLLRGKRQQKKEQDQFFVI